MTSLAKIGDMGWTETAREILTAVIGLVVLGGAGVLIYQGRGSEEQAWLIVGVVVTYFFNRQQQASTVSQVLRSQPTLTATTGPPATITSQPHPDDNVG